MKKLTTEEFIAKAKKTHGDKYDYSKVKYANNKTKVCIICPEHGEFWQTPHNHLVGQDCPQCTNNNLKKNTADFIRQAIEVHANKYDYSKGDWLLDPTHIDNVLKPTEYSYCLEAFTNTYEGSDYATQLGEYNSKYYNYNILQLIRNNTLSDIYNKNYCSSSDFFYAGDSFSINTFHRQFVENRTLNSGKPLGWNIRINAIKDGKANITINKE